ncbi:Ltp family lipoprotein [Microbacterium sp. LWO14-1.2]|uniref:Ltp family lipoprotein n=1 Tax=Microbacterium sp. LWO14-1.2 TaxID=3135263 RepID=UPI003139F222
MTDQNPAPGWYPAPHANNEQRYWDGIQWLEPQPPVPAPDSSTAVLPSADAPTEVVPSNTSTGIPGMAASPHMPAPPAPGATAFPAAAPSAPPKKSKKKGLIIAGSVLAGILIVGGIANAVNGGGNSNTTTADEQPAAVTDTTATVEEEEPVVMVTVPDVTGMTAAEALVALTSAGLNPPVVSTLTDPLAKVLSTNPAAGASVEEGADITLALEEKPKLTIGQENAIRSAKNYLGFTGFSRTGLIGQLEFEGFSTEDATFAVDNAGADWNAEAAEKAASYLEFSSFSRQGLYDQLAYEGFLPTEIEFGLAAVGY